MLRTTRTSAMKTSTALLNQISAALTSANDAVRAKYRGLNSGAWGASMATSRPSERPTDPVVAALLTLKRMGTRHQFLSEEIAETDAELAGIVSIYAPEILEINGAGTVVAPPDARGLRRQPRSLVQ